jgi:hypothetical protein
MLFGLGAHNPIDFALAGRWIQEKSDGESLRKKKSDAHL